MSRGAELAEPPDGDEDAVDEGLARALVGDRALDEELAVLRLGQAGQVDGLAGDVEDGLDEGLALARPDEVGGTLVAQDEADGVDDDGLAGAGLAGQDGEAGVEMDLEVLDRRQIPDAQELDHVVRTAS